VSRNANGLGHPDAIGAHVWTHIARVQPPHVGHTVLAGAENASIETGTQDRGLGPGRYHGPGPSRGTEIIMGDSQDHARGLDLESGDARGLTRGHCPVPVLVRGLARGHAPDRGRTIGEVDTESTLADLAPEVGPRVPAAVGNAKDGESEVARRIGRKEKGGKMGWHRPLL